VTGEYLANPAMALIENAWIRRARRLRNPGRSGGDLHAEAFAVGFHALDIRSPEIENCADRKNKTGSGPSALHPVSRARISGPRR